jgi:hypothetical protein
MRDNKCIHHCYEVIMEGGEGASGEGGHICG